MVQQDDTQGKASEAVIEIVEGPPEASHLEIKQLFDSDQCSEMAKYYTKLTRKYLLNPVAHSLSEALKLSEWNLRAINQSLTVSFYKNKCKTT